MDKTHKLMLGIFTVVALCKYSQAQWNATKDTINKTVSCGPHDNNSDCADEKDIHRQSGHFSKCPQEYEHFCIHGTCQFVQEQNTPACRCESGYIGSRCEYLDLGWLVGDRKHIVIAGVIVGLVFLLLVIVFTCICVHRLKLCGKKRKNGKRDEVERLNTLNPNEASAVPADTSDTNTV
ncbi:probetacellulin isoform X2 [Electrophorus electricus]|uniref:probetacellulin isoform X2 n=1 Tax=Electrophorus electricus TaxID=8005 RepID=UPI000F0A05EA|nr:probetacellulin isoform X2 [Electrophorus electricus]